MLDKVCEHYAKPIIEETNLEKLNKIKIRGIIMFKLSYLMVLCSIVGVFVVSSIFSFGMFLSIYLNWRGETEFFISKNRINLLRRNKKW